MRHVSYKEKLVLQDTYEALLMLDLTFPSSVIRVAFIQETSNIITFGCRVVGKGIPRKFTRYVTQALPSPQWKPWGLPPYSYSETVSIAEGDLSLWLPGNAVFDAINEADKYVPPSSKGEVRYMSWFLPEFGGVLKRCGVVDTRPLQGFKRHIGG